MKINKKGLVALVVIAVIIAVGGLYAYKGEELMGFMRGRSKASKTVTLPWYCEKIEEVESGETGSSRSGGEEDSRSSSSKFIIPDAYEAIKDMGSSGGAFKFSPAFSQWMIDGQRRRNSEASDPFLPAPKDGGNSDAGEKTVTLHCMCLGESYDYPWMLESEYYEVYEGNSEKACAAVYPDKYCADPVTVNCTCGDIAESPVVVSKWMFENTYKSDDKYLCDSYFPTLYCGNSPICPSGYTSNDDRIWDICYNMRSNLEKEFLSGLCPDDLDSYKAKISASTKAFCESYMGADFFSFSWIEQNVECVPYEDCLKYASWFDAGVYTEELDKAGIEGNPWSSCVSLYGM